MQATLHRTPRMRDVVAEQIRIVALALRPAALVLGAVVGIVTLLMSIAIVRGGAETWFDAAEWSPIVVIGFVLPFAVWRSDKPFEPSFLWTLPVDRRRLAIAKVFAGWLWLIAAVAALIVWQRLMALVSGLDTAQMVRPIAFTAGTSAYLLGSATVLGMRYPFRWLAGGVGVIWLIGMLGEVTHRPASGDAVVGVTRFEIAFAQMDAWWQRLPQSSQWALATVISVSAGLIALWAALARHRERRRW